jgi:hypothetical protein
MDSIRMAPRHPVEPRESIDVFIANRREAVLKVVISESPVNGLSAPRRYCLNRTPRALPISDETVFLWSECGPTGNECNGRRGRTDAVL